MTAGGSGDPATAVPSVASTLARAALGIAAVTVLARLAGFARVVVLARTLGPSCIGDTYTTANAVPNIVFEAVAGGALASLVVPVLAVAVQTGDTRTARRITAALLTWTTLVLTPLALAVAVGAPLLVGLLLGTAAPGCDRSAQVALAARLLVVFAPQVVLYGLAVVLGGVLQAHRRFLGPAFAPLLASVVTIGAYLGYATLAPSVADPAGLPNRAELTLGVGTTLGVAALALPLLVPLARTPAGLAALRPTLRFPPRVGRRVVALGVAGVAVLAAQQAAAAVALRLANDGAPPGTVVVYTVGYVVLLLPYAVLVVPFATSAFPALAAADRTAYARTCAVTLRLVLVLTGLAVVLLVAAAEPLARVLVAAAPGRPSAPALAATIRALAPGLVGYALLAVIGRALYARLAGRVVAVAGVAGWAVVAAADVGIAAVLPADARAIALGLGHSAGLTVTGGLLVRGLRRTAGPAALTGAGRASAAALLAGLPAGGVAQGAAQLVDLEGPASSVGTTLLAGLLAAGVYAGVLRAVDRSLAREVLAAVGVARRPGPTVARSPEPKPGASPGRRTSD